LVAKAVSRLIREHDLDVVFFVTQVMDRHITREIIESIEDQSRVRLANNPRFTYQELAGVMSRMELLVGMRTHSLILSCAVGTPVVNINAYPKSAAFLGTVGLHNWSIDFDGLSADSLYEIVTRAWNDRSATRAALAVDVAREKAKAVASARVVGQILNLE
jgi:polysaccharide pyruvyl transferase WcaK-like protein